MYLCGKNQRKINTMTKKEKIIIEELLETEGFDYGFIECGSDLEEIKDKQFQKLRLAYEESRTNLVNYLEEQGINIEC